MKFGGVLISISNMEVSRAFYQNIFGMKVISDYGTNIAFEGGLALQSDFAELTYINPSEILKKSKNFELYFEELEFDNFVQKLKTMEEIEYVHDVKESSWGQRVIRFYDPDMHIIEIGESMDFVIQRFFEQGLTPEEVSERTMIPVALLVKK